MTPGDEVTTECEGSRGVCGQQQQRLLVSKPCMMLGRSCFVLKTGPHTCPACLRRQV